MKNTKTKVLAESAVMLSLAFALSCAKLYEMPLGGSVTVASMLPIMLISAKYGTRVGIGTAFVYSLTQVFQALVSGNVFPYCQTIGLLILCVALDYIIPFTILGFSGSFKEIGIFKNPEIALYIGMTVCVLMRFVCHFITGVAIWDQWAPEGMGKYLYSLAYNGSFLGVDFLICITCAIVILRSSEMRKLINLD